MINTDNTKLILKEGNRKYYKAEQDGKDIFFVVWEYTKNYSLEEVKEAIKAAKLPGYLKEKYTMETLLKAPLSNIFQLEIYNYSKQIRPKNYSLYEYNILVKGAKKEDTPDALKSAFISHNKQEKYYYIACETYDETSILTAENINIIHKYVNDNYKDIEKILNADYSHVEVY